MDNQNDPQSRLTLSAGPVLRKIPIELIFWMTAILSLAVMNPAASHYSLCVFRLLGWHHCPGCGLGHAIAYFIRGNIKASWQSHPLGIPGFLVILHRIAVLGVPYYIKIKKHYYGYQLPLIPARN